ncbi:hypothetical protein GGS24DRAFT_505670 [Hypoxylon argillaceum]
MPENKGQGNAMTPSAASHIQSTQAKSGGDMSSGGFSARAQSAGARNENAGYSSQGKSGGNNSNTGANQGKK